MKKKEKTLNDLKNCIKAHKSLSLFVLAMCFLSLLLLIKGKNDRIYISRNDYGGDEKEISLTLKEDDEKTEKSLLVSPRTYSKKEVNTLMKEAFSYLDDNLKGENKSLEKITRNINPVLDDSFPFEIEMISERYNLINSEGIVNNEDSVLKELGYSDYDIENGIPIKVIVRLWYGNISKEKEYNLKVYQKENSPFEEKVNSAIALIEKEEKDSVKKDGFYINTSYEDLDISYPGGESITPTGLMLLTIVIVILILIKEKEDKKEAVKKRRNLLIKVYPRFVNEFVLLLGAGMQPVNILRLMYKRYLLSQKNGKDTSDMKPLMDEIAIAIKNLDLKMDEGEVYYRLGRKLNLSCYIKLMSLLEQNVKKGTKGLTDSFELEEENAYNERKNIAKKLGEEAGTKLLGPMILMLLVVMLMIMIPAFMSMG